MREVFRYRHGSKARVAIYGAGSAGVQLARALRDDGRYVPVAFVDADPALQGTVTCGVKVHPPATLARLIRGKRISSVLLAMPSSSRRQRHEVLKSLEFLPAHVRTVPDIFALCGMTL